MSSVAQSAARRILLASPPVNGRRRGKRPAWPEPLALARSAGNPVLVCRPTPVPDGPVMVGVLNDTPCEAAIDFAFAAADERGVRLVVLLVGAWSGEGVRRTAELLDRWADKYPEVVVSREIRCLLDPAVTLTAAARAAALLVLGVPAGSDLTATSVVESVTRRAAASVALIPC